MLKLTGHYAEQYPCSLSETGWQRCADDSGDDFGGTYGAGNTLRQVGLGTGVGSGTDLVGWNGNLPGFRNTNGSYATRGYRLFLWSSSESSSTSAWRRTFNYSHSVVYRHTLDKGFGFSVRCLRDTDDTSDFTDPRDGETYSCVKIGNQVWMTENLRYLPSVNTPDDGSDTEPKYYVYDNTSTDVEVAKALPAYQEGVLYNWPAAMASAPEGFHVPTDAEINELEKYVVDLQNKAIKLAGSGTSKIKLNN